MSRVYAIDTNLWIDALRTEPARAALSAFVSARTAFIVMNAVVAQELRAGAYTPAAIDRVETAIVGPFERGGRLCVPTFWAWKETGRILSQLIGKGDWDAVPRSLVNDVLLAMSCRESGVVLVTANLRDFERIAKIRKFDFVAPWP